MTEREQLKPFDDLAREFRRLALGMQCLLSVPASPQSDARREGSNSSLDGPLGEPGRGSSLRYSPWCFYAADHLFAVSDLVRSEKVLTASLTAARAALEALASCYWFYEPDITFEERVRRHLNLRLAELLEAKLLAGDPEGEYEELESAARDSAPLLSSVFTPAGRSWEPAFLGAKTPSSSVLVRNLVAASSESVEFQRVPYRLYSGLAHGGTHLVFLWAESDFVPDETGAISAEWKVSPVTLAALLSPLVRAADDAVQRVGAYQGWDLGAWNTTVAQATEGVRRFIGPLVRRDT